MEHPVKEIAGVITSLTQGHPEEQEATLKDYFLPNASFSHPYCHVPSFSKGTIPLANGIDSLWVILAIYRWYRTLSPHIDIKVDSAVFDQRSGLLYVSLRQTFAVWFIPLYKAPVRLVSVLQLTQRASSDMNGPLYSQVVSDGPDAELASPRINGVKQARTRYYIASQEDLYPVNDCIQFLLPGLGPFLWFCWQMYSTCLCVFCSFMFLPLYLVLNKAARKQKV